MPCASLRFLLKTCKGDHPVPRVSGKTPSDKESFNVEEKGLLQRTLVHPCLKGSTHIYAVKSSENLHQADLDRCVVADDEKRL